MPLLRVSKLRPWGQPEPSRDWNLHLPTPTWDSAGPQRWFSERSFFPSRPGNVWGNLWLPKLGVRAGYGGTPVVPKLRKLRQKDYYEVKASLGYREHKTLRLDEYATSIW